MNGRLIYVAHPFGSTNISCDDVINSNQIAIDKIMKKLVLKDRNNVYLSPLHNFSMLYFEKYYAKGLQICLDMLEKCSVLILCGDWQQSKGCIRRCAPSMNKQ